MARITIEDCLKTIPNRFDLTLAASIRARQLAHGASTMLEANDDKATVIALREMAAGKYGIDILNKNRTDTAEAAGATATEDSWGWITGVVNEAPKEEASEGEKELAQPVIVV